MRPTGKLKEYVTVAQAVELMGYPRSQTGRFYELVKKGLQVYKIGGASFASISQLAELAGLQESEPSWPSKLGELDMGSLLSRSEAAGVLCVSPRTINRMAKRGEIGAVDLSAFGGYTLYVLGEHDKGAIPTYVTVGNWDVSLQIINKMLVINIEGDRNCFFALGIASHPRYAYMYNGVDNKANGIVNFVEALK